MTSQTHFAFATKHKDSKTINKTLNIKNEPLMELKKKEKVLIKKMKAAKNNAVKKKLKQDLEVIQQQIQALIKANNSIITINSNGTQPANPSPTNNSSSPSSPVLNLDSSNTQKSDEPTPLNTQQEAQNNQTITTTILTDEEKQKQEEQKIQELIRETTHSANLPQNSRSGTSNYSFYGPFCAGLLPLGSYWINPNSLNSIMNVGDLPTPASCPPYSITNSGSMSGLCCTCNVAMGFDFVCGGSIVNGYTCPGNVAPSGPPPWNSKCGHQCQESSPFLTGYSYPNPNMVVVTNPTGDYYNYLPCPEGSFSADANNFCCLNCPAGYIPNTLANGCYPSNSVFNETMSCCFKCPADSHPNMNRPNACMSGTGIATDATNNCCFNCPLGSFDNPNLAIACPQGTTSAIVGNNNCCSCPSGTLVNYNPTMTCSSQDPSYPYSLSLTHNHCCFNCPTGSMVNPDRPGNCMVGNPTDATNKCCATSCPPSTMANSNPTMTCQDSDPSYPYSYYMDATGVFNNNCCFNCPAGIMENPEPMMPCPATNPIPYSVLDNNCCFNCPAGSVRNVPFMSCPPGTIPGGPLGREDDCCFTCPTDYEPNIYRPICPDHYVCTEGNLCAFDCNMFSPAGYKPNSMISIPNRPTGATIYPNCPIYSVPSNTPPNICCYDCMSALLPNNFPNPDGAGSCPSPYQGSGLCCRCPYGFTLNPLRTDDNPLASCQPNEVSSDPLGIDNICCYDCTLGGSLPEYFPNPNLGGSCPSPLLSAPGNNNLCCGCQSGFRQIPPNELAPANSFVDASGRCYFQCILPFIPKPSGALPPNSVLDASGNCYFQCPTGSTPKPVAGCNSVNGIPDDSGLCCYTCPNGYMTNLNYMTAGCPDGFTASDGTNKCCFNTDCTSYNLSATYGTTCMQIAADDSTDPNLYNGMIYDLMCPAGQYCTAQLPVTSTSMCLCATSECGNMVIDPGEDCDPEGSLCGDTGSMICDMNCMCSPCENGHSLCGLNILNQICCPTDQCAMGTCCTSYNQVNCMTPRGDQCCDSDSCRVLFNSADPANSMAQICCTTNRLCGTGALRSCCDDNSNCINNNCCPLPRACGSTCCPSNQVCNQSTMTCVAPCNSLTHPQCGTGGCPPGQTCNPVGILEFCRCTGIPTCGNGMIDPGENCEPPGLGRCGVACRYLPFFCMD